MDADDPRITVTDEHEPTIYVLSDEADNLSIASVAVDKANLVSDDVCLVDICTRVFIWIGKRSTRRDQRTGL